MVNVMSAINFIQNMCFAVHVEFWLKTATGYMYALLNRKTHICCTRCSAMHTWGCDWKNQLQAYVICPSHHLTMAFLSLFLDPKILLILLLQLARCCSSYNIWKPKLRSTLFVRSGECHGRDDRHLVTGLYNVFQAVVHVHLIGLSGEAWNWLDRFPTYPPLLEREGGKINLQSEGDWKWSWLCWWSCSRQSVVHLFEQLWTWIETWEALLPCLSSLMKDFKPNITSFIRSLQFRMFDARRFFLIWFVSF